MNLLELLPEFPVALLDELPVGALGHPHDLPYLGRLEPADVEQAQDLPAPLVGDRLEELQTEAQVLVELDLIAEDRLAEGRLRPDILRVIEGYGRVATIAPQPHLPLVAHRPPSGIRGDGGCET